MNPTYRDSSNTTIGLFGSTSADIDKPAGTVEGDLLILAIANQSPSGNINNPTGGAAWSAGPTVSGAGGIISAKTWYKWAGASEPATYGLSIGIASDTVCILVAVENPHESDIPVSATSTTRTTTTVSTPGVTPNSDQDLELRFAFANRSGALTFAPPATYTEREDLQANSEIAGTLATKALSSSAATGALNFTTSATNNDGAGITFAIGPGSFPQTVTPTGIASEEAVGTAQLNLTIGASGIASLEAFGGLTISTPEPQIITGEGIASGEVFGTLTTTLYLSPSGIASGEAFGASRLSALIGPTGIPSAEAFGLTNLGIEQFLSIPGITSGEAFGAAALQLGYPQTIEPFGIESAELVEDPTIRNLSYLVLVNPSIQETPAAWDRLNIRFGLHRGITIMQDAEGVWSTVRYPAQTEIEAAQVVYMGGHRHVLTVAEADALILAGYGSYITLETIT